MSRKLISKQDARQMGRVIKLAAEGADLLGQETETGKYTFKEMSRRQRQAVFSLYYFKAVLILLVTGVLTVILSLIAYNLNPNLSIAVFLIGIVISICLIFSLFKGMNEGRTNPIIPTRTDVTLEQLKAIDPYAFERLVAGVYQSYGFQVKVTSHSGDHGVDVKAWRNGHLKVIQCKRYSGKTGVETVRELAGTRIDLKADSAT